MVGARARTPKTTLSSYKTLSSHEHSVPSLTAHPEYLNNGSKLTFHVDNPKRPLLDVGMLTSLTRPRRNVASCPPLLLTKSRVSYRYTDIYEYNYVVHNTPLVNIHVQLEYVRKRMFCFMTQINTYTLVHAGFCTY